MSRTSSPQGIQRAADHVMLAADWVERWLPKLSAEELRSYIGIARVAPLRTYHDPREIAAELGSEDQAATAKLIERLESHGLIEVVTRGDRQHFHFRCRGRDGMHRADPAQPSVREALEYHRAMMQELVSAASEDETDALRDSFFEKYPALRAGFDAASDQAESGGSNWRLWLELSQYLIGRFEERYGALKAQHSEVFKEVSAQILRLKLEVIERLTKNLLERRTEIFPIRGDGWIARIDEHAFTSLPIVRELSRKYRVGAEQLYLSTIEMLEQEGTAVIDLDSRGQAVDLQLPTTTGLTGDEERLVFLHIDEMSKDEILDYRGTLDRIQTARRKYADHLVGIGVGVLADLSKRGRLADREVLTQIVKDRVNEALELVENDDEDPRLSTVVSEREINECYARAADVVARVADQ